MAFLRLMLILFILLSVIYIALVLWAHFATRRALIAEWDATPVGSRDDFLREGLRAYRRSFQRKLILLVYVIPLVLIGTIIYVTNFA